jgi:hypothetical protein
VPCAEINYPTSGPKETYYGEYRLRRKKDGTLGRRLDWVPVPYCPLYECLACHDRSGGHRIQYRPMLAQVLCMSCWNRLRVIQRDQDRLDELGYLTRKLLRTKHVDEYR